MLLTFKVGLYSLLKLLTQRPRGYIFLEMNKQQKDVNKNYPLFKQASNSEKTCERNGFELMNSRILNYLNKLDYS